MLNNCSWLFSASVCTEWSLTHSAAAKSLQLCLTLCDPIDGSPPSSPRSWDSPGKNTRVGCHSFSNAWKWKVKVRLLSHVLLLATPWAAAYQAPLSMGFSRQEYWNRVPSPLRWPTQLHPKAARLLTFTATVVVSLFAFQGCSRATEVGMGRGQDETPHHLWAVLRKIQLLFLNNSP